LVIRNKATDNDDYYYGDSSQHFPLGLVVVVVVVVAAISLSVLPALKSFV
jgi:hypothetical protein